MCCSWQCARQRQHVRATEQAQSDISRRKIAVTFKSPVGDISAVTLMRTDTTLEKSQKAEKVCSTAGGDQSTKHKTKTGSALGLGGVNAQTGPLVLNSFRSFSLANQTHDHRDWGRMHCNKSQIHIDVSHSRQPLLNGERSVHYAVNTVMLVNVRSHLDDRSSPTQRP